MVIAESLEREISMKMSKIAGNPSYYLSRDNRVRTFLTHIKDAHSFWLEHPDMRRQVLDSGEVDAKKLKRVARNGARRINEAWRYLSGLNNGKSVLEQISYNLILDVGRIVEPVINARGFREGRVSLGFDDYCPPNPVKVPELVRAFCHELKSSDLSPVEAAAYAHLHIAGIQPFENGNKRVARLFQDKILDCNELPPAVIPSGERQVYLDLLEQALAGIRDGKYGMQRPFFDYIGGKVNSALDDIIGDLELK